MKKFILGATTVVLASTAMNSFNPSLHSAIPAIRNPSPETAAPQRRRNGLQARWTRFLKTIRATVLSAALIAGTDPSFARSLITCRAQVGKSFVLADGIVPAKDAGWVDDGISKSLMTLSVDDNSGQYDLVEEGGGRPFSYRSDGCSLIARNIPDNSVMVLAVCPGVVDTYQFITRADGITMLFTQNKQLPNFITKMSVFTSRCERVGR
jgi:hypothetical protein